MKRALTLAALLALLVAAPAAAQIQTSGPEQWPGKNAAAVRLGWQNGIGGYYRPGYVGTPSGFKVFADYNFRFQDKLWLNLGANFVFAGGCDPSGFCFFGGNTVEPHAGLMLTFTTPIPIVPYVQFQAMFV